MRFVPKTQYWNSILLTLFIIFYRRVENSSKSFCDMPYILVQLGKNYLKFYCSILSIVIFIYLLANFLFFECLWSVSILSDIRWRFSQQTCRSVSADSSIKINFFSYLAFTFDFSHHYLHFIGGCILSSSSYNQIIPVFCIFRCSIVPSFLSWFILFLSSTFSQSKEFSRSSCSTRTGMLRIYPYIAFQGTNLYIQR